MLKFIRIVSAVLLVSCMIFIFSMSSQNAEESSGTSGRVITVILKILQPDFDHLSLDRQTELISSLQFFVRKGAHFTIYMIMGILAFFTVGTYPICFKLKFIISSLICLLYSVSDELHQLLIPGRSGELRDVCLDFSGSLLALILLTVIVNSNKLKFFNKYFKG